MEFADILTALDPHLPCGDDLEYDAEFLLLQQSAVGKAEQQFGSTIIPADPPDWRDVEKRAHALLERTRDIRIIGYLAQAWTEIRGLPGYADGLGLAADALERYWEAVHPRLDGDGEQDPMPRMNALASLGDVQGCGRSAKSALLLAGRHGQLSLRDVESLLDGSRADGDAYPGGRARLVENLRQTALQHSAELSAVATAVAALERIQAVVHARLGTEWTPDYRGILRTLQSVLQTALPSTGLPDPVMPQQASGKTQADMDKKSGKESAVIALHAQAQAPGPLRWQDAQIQSREDAVAMLAKVCGYFDACEPSHPAPYLIRRAQQLISLSFHDIIRNLAPQGLDQFEAWLPRDPDGRPVP